MRYTTDETTTLVGLLPEGATATIAVLRLANDTAVSLDSAECTESQHMPGVYLWNIGEIAIQPTSKTEYVYEMEASSGEKFRGKFVLGGYVDDIPTADENADTLLGRVI